MLASYLGVGGCREEKIVSLIARCAWVLGVGEEKSFSLLLTCGCVSGGEMC